VTPLCPRCSGTVETSEHVLTCSPLVAVTRRSEFFHGFLSSFITFGTLIYIIATFELKLSTTFDSPYSQSYHIDGIIPTENQARLLTALRHQNIIGWHNFLRGYIFIYWEELYYLAHESSSTSRNVSWSIKLVEGAIDLYRKIWSDRNLLFMALLVKNPGQNYGTKSFPEYNRYILTPQNYTKDFRG
jgi:hypothetical protein